MVKRAVVMRPSGVVIVRSAVDILKSEAVMFQRAVVMVGSASERPPRASDKLKIGADISRNGVGEPTSGCASVYFPKPFVDSDSSDYIDRAVSLNFPRSGVQTIGSGRKAPPTVPGCLARLCGDRWRGSVRCRRRWRRRWGACRRGRSTRAGGHRRVDKYTESCGRRWALWRRP